MTADVYTRIVCPLCRCSALVDWLPAPSGHGRIMEHDAMVEAPDFEAIAEMRCPATGRTVRRSDRSEP